MTTTPVRTRLSCRNVKSKPESSTLQSLMRTPSNRNPPQQEDGDCSPIYFQLTQESNEEIDVLWDWHSPQTSQKKRAKQKRLMPTQSPKFPIKRYPSNQNQHFERLHNELKALQEELARPDDESCLCVSPQQEVEFKGDEGNRIEQEIQHFEDFEDCFNDSMDEQLLMLSQAVEDEMLKKECTQLQEEKYDFTTDFCDNSTINTLIEKYTETKANEKVKFPRTLSDDSFSKSNVIQTASGKLEFHRTKSFEMTTQSNLPKNTIEEIERKRLEAKAKLEMKRKKDQTLNLTLSTQCSFEEIEKKRLQALAKLEAKRMQDIERNRQEAIKKLQATRMKKVENAQVKSALTNNINRKYTY